MTTSDSNRTWLVLVLAGLLLVSAGTAVHAVTFASGPYDYEVTATPVQTDDYDANSGSMPAEEQDVVIQAVSESQTQPQTMGTVTVTEHNATESVTTPTLDSAPESFDDGDVVALSNDGLTLLTADSEGTYEMSVTKSFEDLNPLSYGIACIGLFVIAFGLNKRGSDEN